MSEKVKLMFFEQPKRASLAKKASLWDYLDPQKSL